MYRCEAENISEFIRHLAVNYISRGYLFYVTGEIPTHKDPAMIDAKIIAHYGIDVSKWTRARRRRNGEASVQYLRWNQNFVLVATHGEHRFFEEEKMVVQDFRRRPLRVAGYSIGYCQKSGHVSVRMSDEFLGELKARLLARAATSSAAEIAKELGQIHFEPFAPVRRQVSALRRMVNRIQKQSGKPESLKEV